MTNLRKRFFILVLILAFLAAAFITKALAYDKGEQQPIASQFKIGGLKSMKRTYHKGEDLSFTYKIYNKGKRVKGGKRSLYRGGDIGVLEYWIEPVSRSAKKSAFAGWTDRDGDRVSVGGQKFKTPRRSIRENKVIRGGYTYSVNAYASRPYAYRARYRNKGIYPDTMRRARLESGSYKFYVQWVSSTGEVLDEESVRFKID